MLHTSFPEVMYPEASFSSGTSSKNELPMSMTVCDTGVFLSIKEIYNVYKLAFSRRQWMMLKMMQNNKKPQAVCG